MRQSYTITKAKPSVVANAQFHVGTVMVSNPTISAILVAAGRSDVPTIDSADFVLPSGTIVQLSVVSSNSFTFAFAAPASLPPVGNTAQIGLISNDEMPSALGMLSLGSLGSTLVASFDLIEATQPVAPAAGFDRLWADLSGNLHALDALGDRQLATLAGVESLTNKTFDSTSNVVQRIGKVGPIAAPAASVGFNAIPIGFSHLDLIATSRQTGVGQIGLRMQVNGDVAAHYYTQRLVAAGATVSALETLAATSGAIGLMPGSGSSAVLFGSSRVFIPNASDANFEIPFMATSADVEALTTGNIQSITNTFNWDGEAPISSILLFPASGNFEIGSTFWLYGYP